MTLKKEEVVGTPRGDLKLSWIKDEGKAWRQVDFLYGSHRLKAIYALQCRGGRHPFKGICVRHVSR